MMALSVDGFSQNYPIKPIRLVLPVAPGGGADIIARLVSQKVGMALGKPFILDNRGGAGGNIAAELVAKAEPDGYTLLMVLSSHTINGSLYKKLNYDPIKDFIPAGLIMAQVRRGNWDLCALRRLNLLLLTSPSMP